jgi:hypothetical protein
MPRSSLHLPTSSNIETNSTSSAVLNPEEIIEAMIDLRVQLAELEQQVQVLQPLFYEACTALDTNKIALERALITRRITPGRWDYSADILAQETLLKRLRQQFQEHNEPTHGREVTWAIKLL